MKIFKVLTLLLIFTDIKFSYSQFSPVELYSKGLQKFYDGQFQEAVGFFDDYIKVATNDVRGYNYRGLSYMALKNYQRAVEDFTSILTINTTSPEGYTNRGYAYLLMGNTSSSLNDFANSIQYAPAYIEAYIGKSRTNTALGDFSNAMKNLNMAQGITPKNPRVFINKAWIYYLQNDTNNFFDNVYSALYNDSDIVFTSFEKDLIFLKVEIFKMALKIADESVSRYPDNYFFRFTRGFVYYLLDNYTEATKDLQASAKLNKNKTPLYNKIIDILNRSIERNS